MKVDEALEKGIEALGPDEEVVALMPTKEFVIPHGPKRTVLYWLCGDVEMTVEINDSLEGEPQCTGLPLTPTWHHTTILITYILPGVKALLAYLTVAAVPRHRRLPSRPPISNMGVRIDNATMGQSSRAEPSP